MCVLTEMKNESLYSHSNVVSSKLLWTDHHQFLVQVQGSYLGIIKIQLQKNTKYFWMDTIRFHIFGGVTEFLNNKMLYCIKPFQ